MRDFRYLDVCINATPSLRVYTVTESFPKIETYGLAATLRRGSAQMTMKVAEGAGQDEAAEFSHCLRASRGMALQVEYQVLLARDLHFIEPSLYEELQDQLVELRKMLSGLIRVQPV